MAAGNEAYTCLYHDYMRVKYQLEAQKYVLSSIGRHFWQQYAIFFRDRVSELKEDRNNTLEAVCR